MVRNHLSSLCGNGFSDQHAKNMRTNQQQLTTMKRRSFLKKAAGSTLFLSSGSFPLEVLAAPETMKLTILHTNDVHSRIEPFPMDGSDYAGMGGAAKRAGLIKKIRATEKNVLLFDCGDIFQGTPYFNKFGGELEFKLMSKMGYDASTLGNHDFDAGLDGLNKQLPHTNFPFLVSNYDFSDTPVAGKIEDYRVFEKEGFRIGVFGLGIELEGLVPPVLFGETRHLDPIKQANKTAAILRGEEGCDYVICLSHLGYTYKNGKICDITLAKQTNNIDLILGGHTHTFMEQPDQVANKSGKMVLINQAGWAGLLLGRLDVFFEHNRKSKCITCKNQVIN